MLTAGLPLPKQRLSAELLPRAAARAGLQGRWLRRNLDKIPELALPALLLLRDGRSALLLGWEADGQARIMPSETEGGEVRVSIETLAEDYSGRVFFAQPQHKFDFTRGELVPRASSWFRDTLKRSRWLYIDAVAASLLINLIGLGAPLFVMNVYDRVIPNKASATLWVLALGVLLALAFDFTLRLARARLIDEVGRKLDAKLSQNCSRR